MKAKKFRLPRKDKKRFKKWEWDSVAFGTFRKYFWNQKAWDIAREEIEVGCGLGTIYLE